MKCIYCQQPAGFLKTYHDDCRLHIQSIIADMKSVADITSDSEITKIKLQNIAISDDLFSKYLLHQTRHNTYIRNEDILLYYAVNFSVYESKNHCSMTRTGYSYRKYPIWKETNYLISNMCGVILTQKHIYFEFDNTCMIYPYSKINNVGYDTTYKYLYFDIKTTSSIPHRFTIKANFKHDTETLNEIHSFLNCLCS